MANPVCNAGSLCVVAGLLAIAWGGLARIGEVLSVKRPDLVLPKDFDKTAGFAPLAVKEEPKTRFSF